jgi:hypothetical protein
MSNANPTSDESSQCIRYGRILRRLRQRIFDYDDSEKADRVLKKVKARYMALRPSEPTDEMGLTATERRALRAQGVLGPDLWF